MTDGADGRSRLDLAQPISVLGREEIDLKLRPSIGETLSQEPGVTSTYFAPGASRPVIRGLGGDRVRVLQNGIGTGDASSTSADHAVSVDPLSAERIEIVRGAATLLYGSSAIDGVVNVIDNRIADSVPSRPITGSVSLNLSSVAEERTGCGDHPGVRFPARFESPLRRDRLRARRARQRNRGHHLLQRRLGRTPRIRTERPRRPIGFLWRSGTAPFLERTGIIREGFPEAVVLQADAEFYGAELQARFELLEKDTHHLDLQISGDWVRAESSATGEPLPRIPPLRYGLGLNYRGRRWRGLVEARRVEEQDRIGANETPTGGYTLVNASLGYRLTFSGQFFDIMLRGRNLTDEEARNHVSFLKDRVPLPGRDVSLSLRLHF